MDPPVTFDDIDLSPSAVLGERTFGGALYDPAEAEQAVQKIAGASDPDVPPVDQAVAFADRVQPDGHPPYVAKNCPREHLREFRTTATPYTACVFCHYSVVGALDRHRAYLAAWHSEEYDVDVDADYETSDLAVVVERRDGNK